MPQFTITIDEVVRHRFVVEAPDVETARQVLELEPEAVADACSESDGTDTEVVDRTLYDCVSRTDYEPFPDFTLS